MPETETSLAGAGRAQLLERIAELLSKVDALEADNDDLRAKCQRFEAMAQEMFDNLTHTQIRCDELLEANRRARGLIVSCDVEATPLAFREHDDALDNRSVAHKL
jgi:hypothetical protein